MVILILSIKYVIKLKSKTKWKCEYRKFDNHNDNGNNINLIDIINIIVILIISVLLFILLNSIWV